MGTELQLSLTIAKVIVSALNSILCERCVSPQVQNKCNPRVSISPQENELEYDIFSLKFF